MKTFNNKITLNLDSDAEVNVKGFIAPIEHYAIPFSYRMACIGESARC